MPNETLPLVDWPIFETTRTQLGAAFMRIFGYFIEDGMKAVGALEEAVRANDAAAMVIPAHTLKSEARQFGGERLGQLAEDIEMYARNCVEMRARPDDCIDRVVCMRPLLADMLAAIEGATNPLVRRRPGFGRKVA